MHAARFMRRLAKDHGRVVAAATAATAALAASAGTATDGVARSEGRLATTAAPFHWAQPWHATASSSSSPLPALARAEELRARYACQSDRVLGRGGFGLVLEARCRRSDRRVALKRVAKRATSRAKFLQEVAILRALGGRHHVLSLCEAFETPDAFVLVTELVEGRELFEQLVEHGALDERRAQQLARQLARALAHVHAQGVVHGDLKPENVLVTDDETKLIDFGQAFRERESSERARCVGSGVATTAYAAPEVLAAAHATEEKDAASALPLVDRAIDLWGLGVVLYTALCGFHPFDPENDASDAELVARIRRGAFETDAPEWEALPAPARELITRLLQVDAALRPSAAEVLQCAWLRQPQ